MFCDPTCPCGAKANESCKISKWISIKEISNLELTEIIKILTKLTKWSGLQTSEKNRVKKEARCLLDKLIQTQ